MTNKEYYELINSDEVKNFILIVKEYCNFIEDRSNLMIDIFLNKSLYLLVNLYQRTINLHYDHNKLNEEFEFVEMKHEEWDLIYKDLNQKLGKQAYYRIVFDPDDPEESEPVYGNLADDFTDIYRDLKDALLKFEIDDMAAKIDALYDFKMNFVIHWGKHLTEAVLVLHHRLIFNK